MNTQKIIIADNNKYFRKGLKVILQNISSSEKINEANGGIQLLDLMDKEPADIIFLEVVLNGIDGVEVTRKIKKAYPGIEVKIKRQGTKRGKKTYTIDIELPVLIKKGKDVRDSKV